MNRILLLLGVSLAGVAVGAVGATYVSAQGTPQITRSEILRKSMSGLEGKEVVVFLADVPPGGVAALHYHPGDEAIYMLEGSLLFEPEHEQPFELKAGEITFNPAKHVHKAKNTSSSETAKVLLHDSGKGAAAGDPDTIKGAPCSANLCQPELHVI